MRRKKFFPSSRKGARKISVDRIIPRMLTIRETASLTGLSYEFIRRLCLQQKIVFIRSGSKYLINFDRFLDYLNGGDKIEA